MSSRLIRLRALRTRTVLIAAMTFTIAYITAASLLIVRKQMEQQILANFSSNLSRSVESFHKLQADHLANQQRTCSLLADLPSLKALMTTSDPRTIQDGAVEFWQTSASDLFALSTSRGDVVAAFTRGSTPGPALAASLQKLLQSPDKYEIVDNGRLFAVAVQPLFFGSAESGTVLGYVFTGFAIDEPFVTQLSQASAVDVSFVAGPEVLASSLPTTLRRELPAVLPQNLGTPRQRRQTTLGGVRYLTAVERLSASAHGELQLVLMQSFRGTEQAAHRINQLVLLLGVVATLAGALLMTVLAKLVTQPLEQLAEDVSAFGRGEVSTSSARGGTAEIDGLNAAFHGMQEKIALSNAALLDSERLATIGRMASSVSHDLRHYLASIYANAEFLADPDLAETERKELYADVRSAVLGTTELIDSLLLFSRPDRTAQRQLLTVAEMVKGARALVEAHPDAADVQLEVRWTGAPETCLRVDARQMERVLLNLLLNACQVERLPGLPRRVGLWVEVGSETIEISVTDNGMGVPLRVRDRLFEPFVSEGKQKGTGLGLTLVQSLVGEHGGRVALYSSEPGQTIFKLWLPLREMASVHGAESPVVFDQVGGTEVPWRGKS